MAEHAETRSEEFARLVDEYKTGQGGEQQEAWNLIADFAVENAEFIRNALLEYVRGDDRDAELTLLRSQNAEFLLATQKLLKWDDEEGSSECYGGLRAEMSAELRGIVSSVSETTQ